MANKFGAPIGATKSGLARLKFLLGKNLGGFSLLELLVSIGIFVIITLTVVVNFRSGDQSALLRITAQELAATLRRASTLAQAGTQVKLCNASVTQGALTTCTDTVAPNTVCVSDSACADCACGFQSRLPSGFGIHFTAAGVAGFADGNGDRGYDAGEDLAEIQFSLPQDVTISRLELPIGADVANLDVIFEPPEPVLFFNGTPAAAEARITLRHRKTSQTKAVIIRRVSGRIEVE